jgi:hypothetical protein
VRGEPVASGHDRADGATGWGQDLGDVRTPHKVVNGEVRDPLRSRLTGQYDRTACPKGGCRGFSLCDESGGLQGVLPLR